jgi:hypothetical protein
MATRLEEILARTRDFEKPVELKPVRRPMQEMNTYDLTHQVTPFVMDALETADHYDIFIGKQLLTDLTPMQTLNVLKRVRNQYMREVNDMQREIDRIELLEMSIDDPRADTPWPRYYDLRVKQERKR